MTFFGGGCKVNDTRKRIIARRYVIKAAATLPAVGAFAAVNTDIGPVRIGTLGSGSEVSNAVFFLNRNFHSLSAMSAELICDNQGNNEFLKALPEKLPVYAKVNDILSNEEIEAVLIELTDDEDIETALRALNRKKHVFIYGWSRLDAESLTQLSEEAKRNARILQFSEPLICNPFLWDARNILHDWNINWLVLNLLDDGSFAQGNSACLTRFAACLDFCLNNDSASLIRASVNKDAYENVIQSILKYDHDGLETELLNFHFPFKKPFPICIESERQRIAILTYSDSFLFEDESLNLLGARNLVRVRQKSGFAISSVLRRDYLENPVDDMTWVNLSNQTVFSQNTFYSSREIAGGHGGIENNELKRMELMVFAHSIRTGFDVLGSSERMVSSLRLTDSIQQAIENGNPIQI